MKIQGSCHCGYVTYEAEVDPNSVHICNCTDCQKLTGSAFRVTVHAPTFRLVSKRPADTVLTVDRGIRQRVVADDRAAGLQRRPRAAVLRCD